MNDQEKKSPDLNEGSSTSGNTEKTNNIQQNTSNQLAEGIVKTPRELADEAAKILYEAFEKDFNLTKEEGIRKYHIAKKDAIIQLKWPLTPIEGKTVLGEGQMIMEVNSKGYIKILLATSDGDRAYTVSDLSNDDFKNELPGLKAFISDWVALPSTSKFIKENNTSDYNDEDIENMLAGYEQDPEGSKPR